MSRVLKMTGAAATLALLLLGALATAAATPAVPSLDPVTVTAARTKADHEAIAAAYEAEAVAAETKAKLHRDMGNAYSQLAAGTRPAGYRDMIGHCAHLEKTFGEVAKMNRQMADQHRQIAAKLK